MAGKLTQLSGAIFGRGGQRRFTSAAALAVVALAVAIVAALLRPPVDIQLAPQHAQPRLALSWFGAALAPPSKTDTALEQASINGQLLGVLVAGERSTATLKLQGQTEQVFRLGDTLTSGTRLVAVEHHRVVVEQRGVRRELLLDSDSLSRNEFSAIESAQYDTAMDPSTAQRDSAALALAGMFRAQPVELDDGGRGLLLSEVGDEMAILTDLQSGDIVVAIEYNGEPYSVERLTAEPALWANLALDSELPVTVQRDGSQQTLLINAASLAARVMPNLNN